MDAQKFLTEFGHIANAPGGVARLRELILHLAVTGDLIELNSSASTVPLIESIQRQKREHWDRKRVVAKQASVLPHAFKAPLHWARCRIGDLTLTITGGGTPSKSYPAYWGGDIPWASVKDLKELKYLDETEDHITEAGLKNSASNLIPPNRVIVCTRMGLGKIVINRVAIAINQDLKALELPAEVNPDFFLILYKTREVKGTGTTVAGIKQDQLLALPAALPSVEEQARIVAKVDELMTLCDKLEAQQQQRRKLQNAMRQSTLQAVAAANSPHDLQTAWNRLAENFGQLFSAPEDVNELREVFYQLAVTGCLVPQYSEEGNASELLGTISSIRHQLILKKKFKRIVKLESEPLIIPSMELPSTWSWSRLIDLGEINPRNQGQEDTPATFIPMAGVSEKYSETPKGETVRWGEISKGYTHFANGDVILAKITPCFENGKTAVIRELHNQIGAGSTEFHVFRPIHPGVLPEYIYLFLRSPLFRVDGRANMTGTAGQKRLPTDYFALRALPLPPTQEQFRIVAKLDELMKLCDSLESQLHKANKLAEHFSTATVAVLTGINNTQDEDKPLKAQQPN